MNVVVFGTCFHVFGGRKHEHSILIGPFDGSDEANVWVKKLIQTPDFAGLHLRAKFENELSQDELNLVLTDNKFGSETSPEYIQNNIFPNIIFLCGV